jgi:hypothetical protein
MPQREEIPKIVGIAIAKSPKLVLKLSWRYLKTKKQAQRAERTFKRRLVAAGIDPETARELADKYSSTVSIRHFMKELGVPGRIFNGNDSADDAEGADGDDGNNGNAGAGP